MGRRRKAKMREQEPQELPTPESSGNDGALGYWLFVGIAGSLLLFGMVRLLIHAYKLIADGRSCLGRNCFSFARDPGLVTVQLLAAAVGLGVLVWLPFAIYRVINGRWEIRDGEAVLVPRGKPPSPNHSIEGMPSRLRRLVTPHVKR